MRIIIAALLINLHLFAFGQTDTNIVKEQDLLAVTVDRKFYTNYKINLRRMRRVYPLALEAKRVIEEMERELLEMERNRKKKKYTKTVHKELKEDFTFALKDLYTSEGRLLMKLIHRETGMTVEEIMKKYKGSFSAAMNATTMRLFDMDPAMRYDKKKDWIIELIIEDIESGKIKFDKSLPKVTKAMYKEGMKEYRNSAKVAKKINKAKKAQK